MKRIPQLLTSTRIALIDQALISGTNFITAVLIARTLGLEKFGLYSILFVILILATTIHHSFCSAPMMTLAPQIKDGDSRRNYFRATHTIQILTCIVIATLLLILTPNLIAGFFTEHKNTYSHSAYLLCIIAVPAQEWVRRYLFCTQNYIKALNINIFKTIIYLSLLITLISNDKLTVSSAYLALALSAFTSYLLGIVLIKLYYRMTNIRSALKENWGLGRHLVPAYLLEWVSLQGFLILAGVFIGTGAAGAIRAAQNIVGPLNIAYQAIDNVLPTEGAKLLAENGFTKMRGYFISIGRIGLKYLSILSLILAIFSPWIMGFVYGESFTEYYTLVIWQLLSLLLGYSYKVVSAYLRVTGETKPIFSSTIIGVAIILCATPAFSTFIHTDGVMFAKAIAESCALAFLVYKLKSKNGHAHV